MTQSQNQANGAAILSKSRNEPAESQHIQIQMSHEGLQCFDIKVKKKVYNSSTMHTIMCLAC